MLSRVIPALAVLSTLSMIVCHEARSSRSQDNRLERKWIVVFSSTPPQGEGPEETGSWVGWVTREDFEKLAEHKLEGFLHIHDLMGFERGRNGEIIRAIRDPEFFEQEAFINPAVIGHLLILKTDRITELMKAEPKIEPLVE